MCARNPCGWPAGWQRRCCARTKHPRTNRNARNTPQGHGGSATGTEHPPPSEPDYQIGKTTPPVTPDNADLLRTGLGLGVVLLLMLGLLIVIKRAGFGAAKGGRQFYKILAVSSLGPKEKISLIEVGDHWLLVGITSHSINTLHTMPKDSIDLGNASNAAASFAKMLEKLKAPHNKVNS
ncbi:MAG: flagellar biosynthetic protein FliO [Limnobacter sp.]|nr:flagellar biosynthetic protein FliO [Limnobacter sp.]